MTCCMGRPVSWAPASRGALRYLIEGVTGLLKSGIENMLMHYIPEVKEVVAEDEGGDDQQVVGGAPKDPMEQFLSK